MTRKSQQSFDKSATNISWNRESFNFKVC